MWFGYAMWILWGIIILMFVGVVAEGYNEE